MVLRAMTATALALAVLIPVATTGAQSCTGGLQLIFCGSTEVSTSPGISGRTFVVVTALSAAAFTAIRAGHKTRAAWKPASNNQGLTTSTLLLVTPSWINRTHTHQPEATHQASPGKDQNQDKASQDNKASQENKARQESNAKQETNGKAEKGSDQENPPAHVIAGDEHDGQLAEKVEDGHDLPKVDDGGDETEIGEGCHLELSTKFVTTISHVQDDLEHKADVEEEDDDCSQVPITMATPEPASLALFGTGILGFAGACQWRRRRTGID